MKKKITAKVLLKIIVELLLWYLFIYWTYTTLN